MIITDTLEMDRDESTNVPIFQNGLHCSDVSWFSRDFEQACEVHGMDCDSLIQELNEFLLERLICITSFRLTY
jgi:hypothetical protein